MSDVKKPKKKKGPIRFEAILPAAIIVGLVWAYFFLFFDSHLRAGLEYGGTQVHGAEANIGSVKTSFWGAELSISGIQVTNQDVPTENILEIGRIHTKLSWDALLRGKLLVEDASIKNIQTGTKRKHPGRVLPKPKGEDGEMGGGLKGKALTSAAKMVEGADPVKKLKDPGQLESQKYLKNLQTQLTEREKVWSQKLSQLGSTAEYKSMESRIRNLKVGGTNNPQEIQKQIQEIQSVLDDANKKVNEVRSQGNQLNSEVGGFSSAIQEIDKMIAKDREALASQLQLPKLDTESLSRELFGDEFNSKIDQVKKYLAMAKKQMPPPTKSKEERKAEKAAMKPKTRASGINVRFPITQRGYPLFWAKHISITSKAEGSPFGGDIDGKILDLTSNPPFLRRPTLIDIKGSFPNRQIYGVDFSATIDHTKVIPVDKATIRVGAFPVREKMLSESDSLRLGFNKAQGGSITNLKMEGDVLSLVSRNVFSQIDYVADSNSEQISGLLKNAVKDVPKITVDAHAKGTLENLRWDISSNLGAALQRSFEKQLKAKLEEAKKKIRAMVDDRVNAEKAKVTGQYNDVKRKFEGQVDAKKKEADQIKNQAQKRLDDARKQAVQSVVPSGNDLKKKLGF